MEPLKEIRRQVIAETKAFKEALADALGIDWRNQEIVNVQIHLHDGDAPITPGPRVVITRFIKPGELVAAQKVIEEYTLGPTLKSHQVEYLGPALDAEESPE